jgi:hypothetical protein
MKTGKRAWVAEIVGRHAQYGLDRRFPRAARDGRTLHVTLHSGKIYDVCCPERKEWFFVAVRDADLIELDWRSVYARASDMDSAAIEKWLQAKRNAEAVIEDDMSDLWGVVAPLT